MEIFRTLTAEVDAGQALTEVLHKYENRPILLMLSGGSAFSLLKHIDEEFMGEHITLTVLDERCSSEPTVNNYLQLAQTDFYKLALEKGVKLIATGKKEGEDCGELASRWEAGVKEWKSAHLDGVVVATMGMGEDGHTAGIFPGDRGVDFDGEDWVVSYSVPADVNEFAERMTVTNTFLLKNVEEAVVFATGEKKRAVIDTLSRESDTRKTPAAILSQMKSVQLFTDL